MTQAEILSEFKRMSPAEQQALYKALQHVIEKTSRKRAKKDVDFQPGRFIPSKDSSLFRVLGALREAGKAAPNDEEVEQMIANYLIEKHA